MRLRRSDENPASSGRLSFGRSCASAATMQQTKNATGMKARRTICSLRIMAAVILRGRGSRVCEFRQQEFVAGSPGVVVIFRCLTLALRRADEASAPTRALDPEVAVGSRRIALADAGGASHAGFHTIASGVLCLVHGAVGHVQQL